MPKTEKGFTLIAVTVVMVTLVAMGGAAVMVVKNQSKLLEQTPDASTAKTLAILGLEDGINGLTNDNDWTDNTSPQNKSLLGGTYTITPSSATSHNITLSVTGRLDGKSFTLEKTIDRSKDSARDIMISTQNITLSGDGKTLEGLEISNIGSDPASLNRMIVSWRPTASDQELNGITLDGTDKWTWHAPGEPDFKVTSNVLLSFDTDYILPIGGAISTANIEFDQRMDSKLISIYFLFTDGSSRQINYNTLQGTQIAFLVVDVNTPNVYESSGKASTITEIVLTNSSTDSTIVVESLNASWFYPNPSSAITEVKFTNKVAWAGTPAPSGTTMNLTVAQTDIAAGDSEELKLEFGTDETVNYRDYTFRFTMQDGSSKIVSMPLAFDQASQLDANYFSSEINSTTVQGQTLRNTHSDGKIWLKGMQITIDDDDGQTIDDISIDGTEVFSLADEPDDLGVTLSIDVTTINSTAMSHLIDFSYLPSSATLNIRYLMVDDTVAEVNVNPGAMPTLSALVTVVTKDATIDSGGTQLKNIFISKSGDTAVQINQVENHWLSTQKRLNFIRFDGNNHIDGLTDYTSGSLITLQTPEVLSNSPVEHVLEFNSASIVDKSFILNFIFSDGSTKNVEVKLDPSNTAHWFGGENWEGGTNFNAAPGFAGKWSSSGNKSVIVKSTNPFSGEFHADVFQNHYLDGETDVPAEANLKISFRYQVSGYEAGDAMFFKVKAESDPAFITVDQWDDAVTPNTYYYYEKDLTPYMNIGETFHIRFEGAADAADDHFYFDELYLWQ